MYLQRLVRSRNRSPHVSDWTTVISQAFFRLLEVASDDIDEWLDGNDGVRIDSVEILHGDEAGVHVPGMLANHLVRRFDIRRRNVVRSEQLAVQVRIFVADGRVGIIT